MAVLDFLESDVFTPVHQNEVPLINSPRIDAICKVLQFAIENREEIFLYGDYDMDGFCSVMVWKEALELLQVEKLSFFHYTSRTHSLDKDILRQVRQTSARVVIICDTGSSFADRQVLGLLEMAGYVPIVIDHHVFSGDYLYECNNYLFFNSHEEREYLENCEVSGAYASLLVAKVLCEKYMNRPLAYNAKVYALASMYADNVDMSSSLARALYASVALGKSKGPLLFSELNRWDYLFGRRFFSYIVAPKLNGCFRMERFDVLNRLLDANDRYKMQTAVDQLCDAHTTASNLTKLLTKKFERTRLGDIVLCLHEVDEETRLLNIRNFTGVIATRIAQEEQAAVVVVVKDGRTYEGSFRDFYNRHLLPTFKLFADCAGHPSAFKVGFLDLNDFVRHLTILSQQLDAEYDKPYVILSSGTIEGDSDIDALALYNEFMNIKPSVMISHRCNNVKLHRSTQYSKYYSVGLPTARHVRTKRHLLEGASILIEAAICRGVELREME